MPLDAGGGDHADQLCGLRDPPGMRQKANTWARRSWTGEGVAPS